MFAIKINLSKHKINVTHKLPDLKNYVGLSSSLQLRIRRSKSPALVDPKKIKNIKGENKMKFEVMILHIGLKAAVLHDGRVRC